MEEQPPHKRKARGSIPRRSITKKKGGQHRETKKKREIHSGDNSGRNDGMDYHGA